MSKLKLKLLACLSLTSSRSFVVEGESGQSRQIEYFSLEVASESQEKVGCSLADQNGKWKDLGKTDSFHM